MLRLTFIPVLFILCSNFCIAQNGTVTGVVTGSNAADTLAGAIVRADGTHFAMADAAGQFTIALPSGAYTLECRLAGYESSRRAVTVAADQVVRVDFMLAENSSPLDEVVISADRYEQKLSDVNISMEVLKPALIQDKNITQLDDALNQVPGVVVADGQASIRGGSGFSYGAGSRVLMLVDDMPMISADAGDIKWNYLPLENLEQVEVVKGASSVLYGSGALNGIINLRTAFARNEPRTQATMFYGGYDAPRRTYKWWSGSSQSQRGVNISHAQKIGRLDLVIGAHQFNDDGFRMLETETRARFNTNLKYSFRKLPQLATGVNVNMMNTRGGLFFLWHNYDSAYIPQGFNIQRYNNNRFNIDPWVTWTVKGDSADKYSVSLRNRYFKTENTNDKNQGSYSELYYSELRYTRNFRKVAFTGGLVYMEQMVLGDSTYGNHRGRNIAGYIQLTKRMKRLTLSAGLRGEYYKLDSAQTVGYLFGTPGSRLPFQPVLRFGANYRAARHTYLRASFGQGYRFPSVAEKFVSTAVSALKVFPNPSLQPEHAWSSEVSVKQGFKVGGIKGYADLAAFYTEYRDMIEFVFDIYRPGGTTGNFFTDFGWAGFKSQNVGQAQISGGEISVNATGMVGKVKTTLLTGYTYINPVNNRFDPRRDTLGLPGVKTLKYRSRHLFKLDVQFEYKWLSFGYSARYQSRIENIDRRFIQSVFEEYSGPTGINFSGFPSTYILPGLKENFDQYSKAFIVQDMRIAFRLSRQVRFSIIVNNIGNIEYQLRPGDVRAPRMIVAQLLVKI